MRLRIAEIREERGLTQEQLGELSGLTSATISRIENGIQTKSLDRLPKIARALGVSVADLLVQDENDLDLIRLIRRIRQLHPDDRMMLEKVMEGLDRVRGEP